MTPPPGSCIKPRKEVQYSHRYLNRAAITSLSSILNLAKVTTVFESGLFVCEVSYYRVSHKTLYPFHFFLISRLTRHGGIKCLTFFNIHLFLLAVEICLKSNHQVINQEFMKKLLKETQNEPFDSSISVYLCLS